MNIALNSQSRHRHPRVTLNVLCVSPRQREWLHIGAQFSPRLKYLLHPSVLATFPSSPSGDAAGWVFMVDLGEVKFDECNQFGGQNKNEKITILK